MKTISCTRNLSVKQYYNDKCFTFDNKGASVFAASRAFCQAVQRKDNTILQLDSKDGMTQSKISIYKAITQGSRNLEEPASLREVMVIN